MPYPPSRGSSSTNSQFESAKTRDSSERREYSLAESAVEGKDIPIRQEQIANHCWHSEPEGVIHRQQLKCHSRNTPLPADHLLTLIYFNVFRGLTWNARILGLDAEKLLFDDLPSPFTPCSPTATSAITRLPAGLRPTSLQRSIDHHPCFDVLPCPRTRDNMIQDGMDSVEDELCIDLMGLSSTGDGFDLCLDEGSRTGITVWGDPWEIENWEISEYLATKWTWAFAGAFELEASTNQRRRARGWKTIYFA